MSDERFGFTVHAHTWAYSDRVEQVVDGNKLYAKEPLDPPRWSVYLPHQCDDWTIATGRSGASQAEAVAALEQFIAEAQEALAALRKGEQFGDPEPAWDDD